MGDFHSLQILYKCAFYIQAGKFPLHAYAVSRTHGLFPVGKAERNLFHLVSVAPFKTSGQGGHARSARQKNTLASFGLAVHFYQHIFKTRAAAGNHIAEPNRFFKFGNQCNFG